MLLSPKQFAEASGYRYQVILKHVREGKLPSVEQKRVLTPKYMIDDSFVEQWKSNKKTWKGDVKSKE